MIFGKIIMSENIAENVNETEDKVYEIPDFIIEYYKKCVTVNGNINGIRTKLFSTPEIEEWFSKQIYNKKIILKFCKNGMTSFSIIRCENCGKPLTEKGIFDGGRIEMPKFCCRKCASSSEETREKVKKTCLEHYGVANPQQSKEIREKTTKTCLEKYGVKIPLQSKEIYEKYEQTNLEKYGVKNPFQNKEIREKVKKTCLEKYGVENPSQLKEIREKAKKTCLEYYGVVSTLLLKESQERRFKMHRFNYWDTFITILNKRKIAPLFSKEEYVSNKNNRERKFKFKCLNCKEEFVSDGIAKNITRNRETRLKVDHIFCPHCFKARYSKGEKEVVSFVKSIYGGEILENHKGLFPSHKQMELDIFIPALNLGIEFDGDYWHSDKFLRNIENDKMKNQLCEEKGIRLIRIKEKDWTNNREQVEKQIREVIEELMNN